MKVYVDVFQAKEFRGVDCGSKRVYVAPFARFLGWQGEIRRVVLGFLKVSLGSHACSVASILFLWRQALEKVAQALWGFCSQGKCGSPAVPQGRSSVAGSSGSGIWRQL